MRYASMPSNSPALIRGPRRGQNSILRGQPRSSYPGGIESRPLAVPKPPRSRLSVTHRSPAGQRLAG
jgi:hypothetical protein